MKAVIDNLDLVMWTKNGAETLVPVFRQINKVLPHKIVKNKIIVDDDSVDETRSIAEAFGWQVIANKGTGISDGTNTALDQVKSEFFASFEQDLVLAYDWWRKISKYFSDPHVAIASGVRLPSQPLALRKLQEYATLRYQQRTENSEAYLYGKTLDNTLYRTSIIKEIGGFPELLFSAGVDNVLAQRIQQHGFKWTVDFSVKSLHLRKGLVDELKHYYWYGTCFPELYPMLFQRPLGIKSLFLRLAFSPFRGLEVALKKKSPQIVFMYPLIRFAVLQGVFEGKRRIYYEN